MKFALNRALAASVSAASLAAPAFAQGQSDATQPSAKDGTQFARDIWGHPPVVHVRLRRGAVARDDQPRQCVVPC